jgi:hypothetical protein
LEEEEEAAAVVAVVAVAKEGQVLDFLHGMVLSLLPSPSRLSVRTHIHHKNY